MKKSNHQQGSVLFISMAFLLLLTLIGVTAMEAGTVEEKMAGNARNRNIAFQAAESALRDGEWLIRREVEKSENAFIDRFTSTCTGGFCASDDKSQTFSTGFWRSADWSDAGTVRNLGVNYASELSATEQADPAVTELVAELMPGMLVQPAFMIEANRGLYAGMPDASYLYRITARGYGGDTDSASAPRSRVNLQEVYRPAR